MPARPRAKITSATRRAVVTPVAGYCSAAVEEARVEFGLRDLLGDGPGRGDEHLVGHPPRPRGVDRQPHGREDVHVIALPRDERLAAVPHRRERHAGRVQRPASDQR